MTASVAATALLCFVPSAAAGGPSNGGFEKGNFNNWSTTDDGAGSWIVYSGTGPLPGSGIGVHSPPQGSYAAVTDQTNPGTHVLYRDLDLPSTPTRISFILLLQELCRCVLHALDARLGGSRL